MRARQLPTRSGSTRQFDFEVAGAAAISGQTSRIDKGPANYRLPGRHPTGHGATIAEHILSITLLDGEER
jgi:hypothetical protein